MFILSVYGFIDQCFRLSLQMASSSSQYPVQNTTEPHNLIPRKNFIRTVNDLTISTLTISDDPFPPLQTIQKNPYMSLPTDDLRTYENRLRTFNVEWMLDFITPEQLARAGFYYFGKQDQVRCCFCYQEFGYWQRGEDPLVEHKRKSPECKFFNGNQGNTYKKENNLHLYFCAYFYKKCSFIF